MILDEPTENLDPTVRNGVIEMVQEIHGQGSTIIFCSHILSEIESLCDTVGVLRQGKIVCSARVDEVRTTHVLRGELDRARTLDQLPPGVTLQKRDGDAIVLELAGGLDQYIDWLAALRLRNVRMELVGLRGLYEEYHQPKSVSDSEVFAEAK